VLWLGEVCALIKRVYHGARKRYERSGRDEDFVRVLSRARRASGTSGGGPGLVSQLLTFTLQGVPDDVVHLQAHGGCGDRRGVGAPVADAQPAQVYTAVANVGAEVERRHIQIGVLHGHMAVRVAELHTIVELRVDGGCGCQAGGGALYV
jgi:hypothetical protein